MGFIEGVSWSLAGAVAHTAIDVLRKLGSQKMAPVDLVALVTVYDAIFATAGVLAVEGSLPDISSFTHKSQFFTVVFITSSLAVLARLLYQRALSIAPLSLTVPYLAFTPAFVVLVSPFFLVGEVPSPIGMLGVFVVSISGYVLGLVTAPGQCDQPSNPSMAKLPVIAPCVRRSLSANTLQQLQQEQPIRQEQVKQQPYRQHHQQQHFQEELRDHNHRRIGDQHHTKHNGSKSSQLSVWAMAYYKGKVTKSAVPAAEDTAVDGFPGTQQWVTASKHGTMDSSRYDKHVSSNTYRVIANGSSSLSETDTSNWDDSQAKLSKDTRADGASAAALAASRAARLIGQSANRAWGNQWLAGCVAAVSGPNAAPALVLAVAFLYSVTASLDKLGIAAANHSLAAYFLGQRLLIGVCGAVYLLFFARSALRHIFTDMLLLCSISLVEQLAVVFYLVAINNILVSYVVAIKRINVLLSTLIGCALFNERVGTRIPYIIVMLCGMLMIVLQPGHEGLHNSHHTRHHLHHMSLL